ncbi:hypothetical protein NDU88_005536 [Pleurodeles waltl]|uniref:Uncharacterized protein n=1 Tax=Pleurodeles waltl TaxID=8319 RepID=A0AAV7N0I3_PLEWA|nr:hypothetical protein NDU88_005536 [Pleurodeles waltl]
MDLSKATSDPEGLPQTTRKARVVTFLKPGRTAMDFKAYLPLSMLNIDYKIQRGRGLRAKMHGCTQSALDTSVTHSNLLPSELSCICLPMAQDLCGCRILQKGNGAAPFTLCGAAAQNMVARGP